MLQNVQCSFRCSLCVIQTSNSKLLNWKRWFPCSMGGGGGKPSWTQKQFAYLISVSIHHPVSSPSARCSVTQHLSSKYYSYYPSHRHKLQSKVTPSHDAIQRRSDFDLMQINEQTSSSASAVVLACAIFANESNYFIDFERFERNKQMEGKPIMKPPYIHNHQTPAFANRMPLLFTSRFTDFILENLKITRIWKWLDAPNRFKKLTPAASHWIRDWSTNKNLRRVLACFRD